MGAFNLQDRILPAKTPVPEGPKPTRGSMGKGMGKSTSTTGASVVPPGRHVAAALSPVGADPQVRVFFRSVLAALRAAENDTSSDPSPLVMGAGGVGRAADWGGSSIRGLGVVPRPGPPARPVARTL